MTNVFWDGIIIGLGWGLIIAILSYLTGRIHEVNDVLNLLNTIENQDSYPKETKK